MTMPDLPTIVYDTKEQKPLKALDGVYADFRRYGLDVTDYALEEDCSEVKKRDAYRVEYGIERKSVSDFISTWFIARKASCERNKIRKCKNRGFRMPYVLDGNENDIVQYDYTRFPSGKITPDVVLAKIAELRMQGHHVITSPSRAMAEYSIAKMLKRRRDLLRILGRRK